jgi:hypothetical protein
VIAGDQNDPRGRERFTEPLELPEGKDDGGVGGANRMEEIAGNDHDVRPRADHPVHGGTESLGDVSFPLVDAARSLPVILPDSEVGIGDVSQFHGWRMDLKNVKIKQLAMG